MNNERFQTIAAIVAIPIITIFGGLVYVGYEAIVNSAIWAIVTLTIVGVLLIGLIFVAMTLAITFVVFDKNARQDLELMTTQARISAVNAKTLNTLEKNQTALTTVPDMEMLLEELERRLNRPDIVTINDPKFDGIE
jgi:hypothetical protein